MIADHAAAPFDIVEECQLGFLRPVAGVLGPKVVVVQNHQGVAFEVGVEALQRFIIGRCGDDLDGEQAILFQDLLQDRRGRLPVMVFRPSMIRAFFGAAKAVSAKKQRIAMQRRVIFGSLCLSLLEAPQADLPNLRFARSSRGVRAEVRRCRLCDRMSAAPPIPMTARTKLPGPSGGRFRKLEMEGNENRSCVSENHHRGRAGSSPGDHPDAAFPWRNPMSIPSTRPGSSWARRQNIYTKKKCKVCAGECVNCPYLDSCSVAQTSAEMPHPRKGATNGRSPARAAAAAKQSGARKDRHPASG